MLLTRFSSSPKTCYEVLLSSLHGCLQLQACVPNQMKVQVPHSASTDMGEVGAHGSGREEVPCYCLVEAGFHTPPGLH